MDDKISEGVCGSHLCFKDQEHKRFVAQTHSRCKGGGNECYDNNPEHAKCTQYKIKRNTLAPEYSYEECLAQCRNEIPGCYAFNYNTKQKVCYHLVLPDGETSQCHVTAESSKAYLTATCNSCPPKNLPRSGCGGEHAGTCPGNYFSNATTFDFGFFLTLFRLLFTRAATTTAEPTTKTTTGEKSRWCSYFSDLNIVWRAQLCIESCYLVLVYVYCRASFYISYCVSLALSFQNTHFNTRAHARAHVNTCT